LSLTMQSLSLLLNSLSLSWSLNKSPWSCPCDCGLWSVLFKRNNYSFFAEATYFAKQFRTVVSLIVSNGILSSVTHYFLQFNSVLIITDLVLVLVLGLECLVLVLVLGGQVLVNITDTLLRKSQ